MDNNNVRLHHLDQLRGLAALSVMLFHIQKWIIGVWNPDSILGRFGVYAVSIFFILSGLTLSLAYKSALSSWPVWRSYLIKRVFRIYPLLLFATLSTCILEGTYDIWQVLINITGLFGFIDPGNDIALGAWSIGVELVCYCFFPIIIWLYVQKKGALIIAIFGLSLVLASIYAFGLLSPDKTFEVQYPIYVQATNHLFLFFGGMFIAWLTIQKNYQLPVFAPTPATHIFWRFMFTGVILWFVYWPVPLLYPGGGAVLISGWTRIVLSFSSFMLVLCWHFGQIQVWGKVLNWLGTISYSVYLLHPLVFRCLKALMIKYLGEKTNTDLWLAASTIACTLLISHLTYHWFEKKCIQLGKRYAISPVVN
jgi:exopolysaccharide production protein ExoZ